MVIMVISEVLKEIEDVLNLLSNNVCSKPLLHILSNEEEKNIQDTLVLEIKVETALGPLLIEQIHYHHPSIKALVFSNNVINSTNTFKQLDVECYRDDRFYPMNPYQWN